MTSNARAQWKQFGSVASAAVVALVTAGPVSAASPNCTVAALTALNVPNMTITAAVVVPPSAASPEYCDVRGTVATGGEGVDPGSAGFQARLPVEWNGKYLASGPGALGGSLQPIISATDAALSLVRGYAFVTNDGGHTAGFFDASWSLIAPGVPDTAKLADYYYRAAHQVTVATKELVKAFYGTDTITRAYFHGCSNGGRNGLMEAMRYPDDFDGIVAGAPYMDIRTQLSAYKNTKAFLNAFIPPAQLAAIDAAVRANCDGADAVVDGLIQNPAKCSFDPQTLVPGTLTQAQADAIGIYLRAVRDERGRLIFPGSSVSDLSGSGGFGGFVPFIQLGPPVDPFGAQPWGNLAPLHWRGADSVIRHMVALDPQFNSNLEWPQTDGVVARKAVKHFDRMTADGDTDEPRKLSRYIKKGGKLLLYHGFSDPVLSPFRTVMFYEDLARRRGGLKMLQEDVRLFMVPGMLHCNGGPGPNAFDTLTAIENWVERGIAPNTILATHYTNNNPALGVDRTMPLCKFPEQARYSGIGSVNEASSWTCSVRDRRLTEVGPNGRLAGLTGKREE